MMWLKTTLPISKRSTSSELLESMWKRMSFLGDLWMGRSFLLAILLVSTGCAVTSTPQPSVRALPLGNAWLMDLPPGTVVTIPGDRERSQLQAIAINEMENGIVKESAVSICSKSYLTERDERELILLKRIEELTIKTNQ